MLICLDKVIFSFLALKYGRYATIGSGSGALWALNLDDQLSAARYQPDQDFWTSLLAALTSSSCTDQMTQRGIFGTGSIALHEFVQA